MALFLQKAPNIYSPARLYNFCVLREAHWDPSLPRAQSCIISVEHVLRPGSHDILYYIILYIILYFNSPRRIKSKEFLQFIFFHSPHRPKPKDFLQLILMIFLLWISFKKHEEIRFLQQISFNAPHQVDQIYLRAVDELPPCPPLKSPNLVFRVKITVLYLFSGSSV